LPTASASDHQPSLASPSSSADDQLHAIRDNVWTGVSNQTVNVVARHDVIEYRKTKALLRFENPAQIRLPMACKLQ